MFEAYFQHFRRSSDTVFIQDQLLVAAYRDDVAIIGFAVPNLNCGNTKNKLVATLLCFFLGTLGIHRFYLGYTGIGVVQLLTGGLLGIWTLIDLFRIIIGDLKPKNGTYGK